MPTFLNPHKTLMLCKFCGCETEITYNSVVDDDYCAVCGAWQKDKYPIAHYAGHLWYVICTDGNGKSTLARKAWRGALKKHGQVSTVIEVILPKTEVSIDKRISSMSEIKSCG